MLDFVYKYALLDILLIKYLQINVINFAQNGISEIMILVFVIKLVLQDILETHLLENAG